MSGNLQVNRREKTAGRLLGAAANNSSDPEVDIDRDAPLDESKSYLPFEHSSRCGTEPRDGLSHRQRRADQARTGQHRHRGVYFDGGPGGTGHERHT